MKGRRFKPMLCAILVAVFLLILLRLMNLALVVDRPVASDVILVPAGDFAPRYNQAVILAQRGYANHIVVDEGAESLTFERTLAERRREQVVDAPVKVTVCPIKGSTSYHESLEARTCLQVLNPKRVLIVTSDFHTRRALAIFSNSVPSAIFSATSVRSSFRAQPWWSPAAIAVSLHEWGSLMWWRIAEK